MGLTWNESTPTNYSSKTDKLRHLSAQDLNLRTNRDSPISKSKQRSPKQSYFCTSGTTKQRLICLEPFCQWVWPNWNQFRDGRLTLGPELLTYWSGVGRCDVYSGVSFRGAYLETEQTCYFIGGVRPRDCGCLMQ